MKRGPNLEENAKVDVRNGVRFKRVGTSYGLASGSQGRTKGGLLETVKPEQLYVYMTDDESHPIRIDGWVGYSSEVRAQLTKRQAQDLRDLLIAALDQIDEEF